MSLAIASFDEPFLTKLGGWEAMQQARGILSSGRVLSSHWTPPVLKGVVQSDQTSYRSGLVIRNALDVDNTCTCRASREWGTICAHSLAVALHWLKPAAPPSDPPHKKAGPTDASPVSIRSATNKDPRALSRDPHGTDLAIRIIFPPNLPDAAAKGRVMLVFEGETSGGRQPLNVCVGRGSFRLDPSDDRLLAAAELLCGGDTPGMVQFSTPDFLRLLPALAGHPRISVGRQVPVEVITAPWLGTVHGSLQKSGEIILQRGGPPAGGRILQGESPWLVQSGQKWFLQPIASAQSMNAGPQTLHRTDVPGFVLRELPGLQAAGKWTGDFDPSELRFEPNPPVFLLELSGGLAQLSATLQCRYGSRIMTVGVTSRDEAAWVPDPENPKRYCARDLPAEHQAFMRLRNAGFQGPAATGQWRLDGQERVVNFFAREYPRMQKQWEVQLEERLQSSTRKNLEFVRPQFRVLPGGESWFDLEVSYSGDAGGRFTASDIQRMLQSGGTTRLPNGRIAVLDEEPLEEFNEVLRDCAPRQRTADQTTCYRMDKSQAGFLSSSIRNSGWEIQAPATWKDQISRQTGEALPPCPPLGPLESVLRDYQRQGVAWIRFLRDQGFGGILADEMGLGKTLQVLAHLTSVRSQPGSASPRIPSLVVCPTSLVFNWVAEAARFTPDAKVVAWHGSQRSKKWLDAVSADLIVTSYALIRRDADRFRELEFDTLVLDEAQHIKNRQTRNAQAVKSVRARRRLVLTGTPLENSILDLWSIMDFLMPGYLGTADDFRERYEIPIVREKDASTLQRLVRRVKPFLLRRLKRDVARELPARIDQITFCELNDEQAGVYQQLLSATRKEVTEAVGAQGLAKSRMIVLTALLRLRQVCCDLRLLQKEPDDVSETAEITAAPSSSESPEAETEESGKLTLFRELLGEVIDGGHRVLVFSQFTRMLRRLQDDLKKEGIEHCYLDGSTTDRGAVVDKFQKSDSIPVFLISLKAGGVGLNLTAADTVIHFDPWWNPAVEDQATDRAHRIGQTRVVTSYKLITRGTIEEKILLLQNRKRELLGAVLTGEDVLTNSLTWEEIQELLN